MAKSNLSTVAYNTIKKDLLTCKYPPNSTINEEVLVKELGISRTPIRSALVRLEQEHMLKILPKKGIYIPDITLEQIRDIYELRCLIEPYAIRNFGNRFSKKGLMQFLNAFSSSDELGIWDIFQKDNCFHSEIVSLCQNNLLNSYYDSIQMLNLRISILSGSYDQRITNSNKEHIAIITALLTDNYILAESLLMEHLTKAKETAYNMLIK